MVKSIGHSSRGPGFESQHLSWWLTKVFNYSPKGSIQYPLLVSVGTRHAHGSHAHMLSKHSYTWKKKKQNTEVTSMINFKSREAPDPTQSLHKYGQCGKFLILKDSHENGKKMMSTSSPFLMRQ